MFIIVNRIGDSITGSINGEAFGVSFNEAKYAALLDIQAKTLAVESMEDLNILLAEAKGLATESYKEVVEHKSEYLYVNPATGKFFLKVGSGADSRVSKVPLPQPFVDRIIASVEKNIDVLPLVKCWARFLRNPNYNEKKAWRFANYINKTYTDYDQVQKLVDEQGVSNEVAKERATTFQTPITQEGLICTYKVSREVLTKYAMDKDGNKITVDRYGKTIDEETGEISKAIPQFIEDRVFEPAVQGTSGDAFYCGDTLGHRIKVGQRHRLESWDQVDTNDGRSCVKGLHCGNLDYIHGYQNAGTETHNVFVDPTFIGAVTDDGSGALRVLEYFVHSSFAGVNKSIYHSSKYAAVTDAAYADMFAEAVAKHEESLEEKAERLNEQAALRTV